MAAEVAARKNSRRFALLVLDFATLPIARFSATGRAESKSVAGSMGGHFAFCHGFFHEEDQANRGDCHEHINVEYVEVSELARRR